MAVRLKLVINKIHWFLIFKSALLAFAWIIFPHWLFLITIALIYFFPVFRPGTMLFPLFLFFLISFILPHNFLGFLLITILLFLILGIKDLIIVNRFYAYELLGFFIFLIFSFIFFQKFGQVFVLKSIIYSFLFVLAFYLFFKKIFNLSIANLGIEIDQKRFKIFLAVFSFFIWQIIFLLNFLPFNFYLQTGMLALFIMIGMDFILNCFLNKIKTANILFLTFSFLFLFIFILLFNKWSL
jgi:hypothetical protein